MLHDKSELNWKLLFFVLNGLIGNNFFEFQVAFTQSLSKD
jgi:hypothetical protein